jgi:REP element-mobilizing transposase RayT
MRRSKIVVCLHFIWAVKGREPLLTPALEERLYRCMTEEAEVCGVEVLALNGMPDHVHLAVKFPATITMSELMKRIKGVSSALANDLLGHTTRFRWQEGYAVF